MGWHSIYHDGDWTLGDMGHVGPYDMAVLNAIAAGLNMDVTGQGPYLATAVLGGFACTGAVSPLTLSSGLGNVNGRLVLSDANSSIAVGAPDAATRWDVLCLQYDPATNQVLPYLHPGVEGAGVYPTLTQDATAWEVPLWGVKITTLGAITLEDLREFVQHATLVTDDNIDDLSISRGKLEALEQYKLIYASRAWNVTDDAAIADDDNPDGVTLLDEKQCWVSGWFHLPVDWNGTSDITIYPLVTSGGAGDCYGIISAAWCAGGEALATHSEAGSLVADTIQDVVLEVLTPVVLPAASLSVADVVHVTFERHAQEVADTVGNSVFFVGFDVRYTSK